MMNRYQFNRIILDRLKLANTYVYKLMLFLDGDDSKVNIVSANNTKYMELTLDDCKNLFNITEEEICKER